jgi:hypothetical protein
MFMLFHCAEVEYNFFVFRPTTITFCGTCAIRLPSFPDILWHLTKIYGPKVFLFTRIKPEYSDILYNLTQFPGPLVCQIRQVLTSCTICHNSLVPWCVRLDRFWHPVQSYTFPWSLGVSDWTGSDILYNLTQFPGPLVCQIRQVQTSCIILHNPWSLGVSD